MQGQPFYGSIIGSCIGSLIVLLISYFLNYRKEWRIMLFQTDARLQEMEKKIAREQRLEHLSSQISRLYGPLAMLLTTNGSVFRASLKTKLWDYYRQEVLLPNNEKIANLIINESHLFKGYNVPLYFSQFLQHHFVWRAYKDSPDGAPKDYLENKFFFPEGLEEFALTELASLKREYNELLGSAP